MQVRIQLAIFRHIEEAKNMLNKRPINGIKGLPKINFYGAVGAYIAPTIMLEQFLAEKNIMPDGVVGEEGPLALGDDI